jgi:rod shape determining protein RodA
MRSEGLDRPLLLEVFLLTTFGLLMLYSAGQTDAPTNAAGAWVRQLVWAGAAIGAGFAAFRVSPRVIEWLAPGIYAFALLLLLITLVIGTGAGSAAGTKSWIAIGGVRLGQPAELAKLGTILFLAQYLSNLREPPDNLRRLIPACTIAAVPTLLVLAQPDLGSAIVFVGILFAMLFWAGVRPALLLLLASPVISLLLAANTAFWIVWMILLGGLLFFWRIYLSEGLLVYVVNSVMGVLAFPMWNKLKPYQQRRFQAFLDPEVDPGGASYQAIQSKVAHGSGGLFGNGYTQGPQKRLAFLPEQHTDFIFPVVGEELGFIGVMAALGLFLLFFLTLLRIARRATDQFGALVVFGVLGLMFTHMWENIGMTVNVMPITGIPLPFFSYGGSFLLTCGVAIGLVLRVAWESRGAGYLEKD